MRTLILYGTTEPNHFQYSYIEVRQGYFVRTEIVDKIPMDALIVGCRNAEKYETLLNAVPAP